MLVEILPGSYCGAAPSPDVALRTWNLDPLLLVSLLFLVLATAALFGYLYLPAGMPRPWRRNDSRKTATG